MVRVDGVGFVESKGYNDELFAQSNSLGSFKGHIGVNCTDSRDSTTCKNNLLSES